MKRFAYFCLFIFLTTVPFVTLTFGERRELIEKRTETSKTFDNGDGTFTAEMSNYPVHFRNKQGRWADAPGVLSLESWNRNYEELSPWIGDVFVGTLCFYPTTGLYAWSGGSSVTVGDVYLPPSLLVRCRGVVEFNISPIPDGAIIWQVGLLTYIYAQGPEDEIDMSIYVFFHGQGSVPYWKDRPAEFWSRMTSPYFSLWARDAIGLSSFPERSISWAYFRSDLAVEQELQYSLPDDYFTVCFIRRNEGVPYHRVSFQVYNPLRTKLLVTYGTESPNTPPNFQATLRRTFEPGDPLVVDTRWDQPGFGCGQHPYPSYWVKAIYDYPRNQTPLFYGSIPYQVPPWWTDKHPGLSGTTTRYSALARDRAGYDSPESPPVDVRIPDVGDPVIAHSTDSQATAYPNGKKVVVDNKGHIHVVFTSGDTVWYLNSKDKAKHWSPPAPIGLGEFPALALDASDRPNICWVLGTQVLMSRYQDAWSPPRAIYNLPLLTSIGSPSFVMKGDTAFASWTDITPDSASVQMASFLPSDTTSPVVVTTVDRGTSTSFASPCLDLDRMGRLNLAWSRDGEVYLEAQGRYRINLSESPEIQSLHPIVNSYGDRIAVVWQEETSSGSFDIVAKTKVAGTWTDIVPIFRSDEYNASFPDVVGASQFVWTTKWDEDEENYRLGRYEEGWVLESQNLSNTLTTSRYPSATFSQDRPGECEFYAVWTESTEAIPPGRSIKLIASIIPDIPLYFVDTGKSIPSPYLIQREGTKNFGTHAFQTADFHPQKLIYRFSGLNPNKRYRLGATYYFEKPGETWRMRLVVDGRDGIRTRIPSGERVDDSNWIPASVYQDGVIDVEITPDAGDFALCNEIALYEFNRGSGGPQTDEAGPIVELPLTYALGQSFPNPFQDKAQISYQLPEETPVSLKVFNVTGQVVRELASGKQKAGYYKAVWDGKDGSGRSVSSGVYFYRLDAGGFRKTNKLVVVR